MIAMIAALALGATPAPLTCPTPDVDRGEVRTGAPLVQTFKLTNPGPQRVRFRLGEAGCNCVRREARKTTLEPGETTDFTLTVNTLTPPPGPNAWATTFFVFPDPDGGWSGGPTPFSVVLRATLVREITVSPAAVAFSTAAGAKQTVTVTDRRAKPLTVTGAGTTSPTLTAAVRPPEGTGADRTQRIDIALSADAPAGDRDETVTLTTDDPACPELRVPVRVSKRAADSVSVAPAAVTLRFADGQSALSALVQLRAGGKPVAVKAATADHPAVSVKWSGPGPAVTLRVSVDRAAAGTGGKAGVRIELEDPAGQTVTVPVTWEAP